MEIPQFMCEWFALVMFFVIAAVVKYMVDVFILRIQYVYY
jgi:hypothetical protein